MAPQQDDVGQAAAAAADRAPHGLCRVRHLAPPRAVGVLLMDVHPPGSARWATSCIGSQDSAVGGRGEWSSDAWRPTMRSQALEVSVGERTVAGACWIPDVLADGAPLVVFGHGLAHDCRPRYFVPSRRDSHRNTALRASRWMRPVTGVERLARTPAVRRSGSRTGSTGEQMMVPACRLARSTVSHSSRESRGCAPPSSACSESGP
jgi:hypothetical protein